MNLDDLTIGQARELSNLVSGSGPTTLNSMIGKKVIVRCFSAGNWFGCLTEKAGNEVILAHARRLHGWKTVKSISLSAIALYGVDYDNSKIVEPVPLVWLEAIEIIPCSDTAITSIEGAPYVKAMQTMPHWFR